MDNSSWNESEDHHYHDPGLRMSRHRRRSCARWNDLKCINMCFQTNQDEDLKVSKELTFSHQKNQQNACKGSVVLQEKLNKKTYQIKAKKKKIWANKLTEEYNKDRPDEPSEDTI